eukprot:gnl/MRDRNA2_/MRDRNA2_86083_c0_seq1.p1 gnl/MRDRNA2_/MRDRNA2_86083_c0~~gnl/MRDRNA2_/MRDRNA2_86083_c0_seq1.p1  ORF type:complete len:451 (-),score=80.01 gnl/MRDRNA2_/MRDRNA2_86083_c0_seq1:493-1845(-)
MPVLTSFFAIEICMAWALGPHVLKRDRSLRNSTGKSMFASAANALTNATVQLYVKQGVSTNTMTAVMKMQMGMRSAKQQCNIMNEYAPEPSQCMKGHDKWSKAQLTAHVPKFLAFLAKQQKILPNHCCMGVNHMFALHYLVDTLMPSAIIESGVAAGHQTFMLRETAAKGTKIFSIDPGDPLASYSTGGFGAWKDFSGDTQYFTGGFFKDFAQIEWDIVIPDPKVRQNTLVVLDDHQSCVERFKVLQKYGFRYAFYEDNYPFKVATSNDPYTCMNLGHTILRDFDVDGFAFGDAFSPNAACGAPYPAALPQFVYKDCFGFKCKLVNGKDHQELLKWLQDNMESYFEFPPLFTMCKTARAPLLEQKESTLVGLGLPSVAAELWQYGHLFPAFIDLKGVGLYTTSTTTVTTTTTAMGPVPSGMSLGGADAIATDRLVGIKGVTLANPGKFNS